MYYVATVHTYDVLDSVHAHVSVRARLDIPAGEWRTVFECTTSVPGIGETDPRQWLADALVGLLEAI